MDEFNQRMHEHALTQAQIHGKRILPADSTKDDTYVGVGALAGGAIALCAGSLLHVHSEILLLVISAFGCAVGFALGHSAFDRFFVKDYSWQPPVMGPSWDAYRAETRRWMGRR